MLLPWLSTAKMHVIQHKMYTAISGT
jgi:hypothetical protein